jgi:hypothetical protein
VKRIFAIIVLLGLAYCLIPGRKPSPEEAIKATIQETAEAARRARPGDFMDHIAEDYQDESLSRSSLRAFVTRRLLAHGGLAVHLGDVRVEYTEGANRARADFEAQFPESLASGRPDRPETRHFALDLVLEDGEWLILSQENERQ